MKKVLLLSSFAYMFNMNLNAQHLVSWQHIRTLNATQIDSMYTANGILPFLFPKRFDVSVYKIYYNTVSYDSSATIATGALALPVLPDCRMPIVSYAHGTELMKTTVASHMKGELPIAVSLASDGFAASLPDYIGMGDNSVLHHPYLHAQSEATASIDMLRASRELIDSLGLLLNGQVFLAGYSQGGHSTMATQKMMEELFPSEFSIAASLPMSGPYDLSGTQAMIIANDSVYSFPVFLPYLLFGYNEVYNIWAHDSDYLIAPYATMLPPLMNGTYGTLYVNSFLPAIPNDIVKQSVIDSFLTDTTDLLRVALRENDLYDWMPVSPTKIMYCTADEQVYYQNAIVAYNSFIANGSTSVQLINAGATLGHSQCATSAFLSGKAWFDSVRTDKMKITFTVVPESSSGSLDGQATVHVTGGLPPYTYYWNTTSTSSSITNVSTGTYTVIVTDSQNCSRTDTVHVGIINSILQAGDPSSGIYYYPNPASDLLYIETEQSKEKEWQVSVYDLKGDLLLGTKTVTQKQTLDCSGLSQGMYIIRFFSGERISYGKLIKN